jgi:hypothetical protein
MTSDSRTYVPHNFKGLLSSEQDPITGVLQYYNSLFKILQTGSREVLVVTLLQSHKQSALPRGHTVYSSSLSSTTTVMQQDSKQTCS